jgi:hypothetical protein
LRNKQITSTREEAYNIMMAILDTLNKEEDFVKLASNFSECSSA